MWRKQDQPQAPSLPAQTKSTPMTEVPQTSPLDQNTPAAASLLSSSTPGRLTRLLTVEGEITGREDLFIDGEVHGKIRLHGGKLTIGPESRVTAEIEAQGGRARALPELLWARWEPGRRRPWWRVASDTPQGRG